MANYGTYYASFGGSFSNVYSQLYIENWTVGATQVTFKAYGGWYADYNWSINYISDTLWYEDESGWHWWYGDDGHSIYTGSGGGSDWWLILDGSFSRTATDRVIRIDNQLQFSGNNAEAISDYLTVPHLAAACSNLTATRNSDTSITLNWTNPSTSYERVSIQYSRNGGTWTA